MPSTGGSVVEFSPATREARVRFPASANVFFLVTLCRTSNRRKILAVSTQLKQLRVFKVGFLLFVVGF